MWILFLLVPVFSWAFPVLHLIKPESNFTQITSLDACTTFRSSNDIVGCNPALFPYQNDQGVRMGLSTITDGESVEVGHKLLFDPIKEEFLQKIFRERSFNSWSANSFIELRTAKFFLAYDPLSVNADVYVFNPSSPEVAMSLVKSNRLQVTTGAELMNNDFLLMSLGAKIFYYRSEYYQDSFFLSDLAGQDVDDLIKLKNKSGVAADIGSYFRFKHSWLPKVSFLIKNFNSQFKNNEKDILAENQMRPLLVYETYSRLGLGYDYKTNWGIFNSEVSFPFQDIYQDLYSEYISYSIGYSLSRFSTSFGLSKYQQIFGFNFGSKIASIGIFYARSRPLGDFSLQTENIGGVRAGVSL
jgi:hypothetical protein